MRAKLYNNPKMSAVYRQVAKLLLDLKEGVALTGAGVSTESGIPTFRSNGGLWDRYDPMVYASIDMFEKDPSKYWTIRGEFIRNYDNCHPNPGHHALAELEDMGIICSVITQNIDGLHTKAGSSQVVEIHGSLRETYCLKCGKEYIAPDVPGGLPPYCECGGVLKPNTVLFGESLPPQALSEAYSESKGCKVMLVIGTSAVVQPAADYFIQEKSGVALPRILKEIRALKH